MNCLKKSIIAAAAAFCAAGLHAKTDVTAAQAFISAPNEVVTLVDSLTRLDMIDYYNSGSTKASDNRLGGNCRVTALTTQSISFTTSAISSYTIVPLSTDDKDLDCIVMVIKTINLPASDSSVQFFGFSNGRWGDAVTLSGGKPLVPVPSLNEWVKKEFRNGMADIENLVPFITAVYSYDTDSGILTMTNTLDRLLPEDDYNKVKDKLLPAMQYRMNRKGRFEKLKQ